MAMTKRFAFFRIRRNPGNFRYLISRFITFANHLPRCKLPLATPNFFTKNKCREQMERKKMEIIEFFVARKKRGNRLSYLILSSDLRLVPVRFAFVGSYQTCVISRNNRTLSIPSKDALRGYTREHRDSFSPADNCVGVFFFKPAQRTSALKIIPPRVCPMSIGQNYRRVCSCPDLDTGQCRHVTCFTYRRYYNH